MTSGERLTCVFNLNFREGTSDKFYTAELSDCTVTSRFGRAYSMGQTAVKSFPTHEAAAKEFFRLARDKMRKGYRIRDAKVSEDDTIIPRQYRHSGEYGHVERERMEITLAVGGKMVDNLTLREPNEDLLFESMFTGGDAELISMLARSHPAVADSDVAGLGAWLSASKPVDGLMAMSG